MGTYNMASSPLFTDGGVANCSALQILANFDNPSGNFIAGASIPVTILFSKPVTSLTFTFYDLDGTTTFNDYVTNISGTGLMNSTVVPTTLTPAAGYNTAGTDPTAGSYLKGGTTNSAQNTGNANATVTFSSATNMAITQFSFIYTDTGAVTTGHSTTQIIGLGDLTFTTVPEPSTWALLGTAGCAGLWALRRRQGRTA